mmetsp:Transcript_4134/g.9384  ORF Transcript_4134/g.9384 Transcript_4134/m.9384 type:complete len:93 (+) Transcript_4134:1984-2262(+)
MVSDSTCDKAGRAATPTQRSGKKWQRDGMESMITIAASSWWVAGMYYERRVTVTSSHSIRLASSAILDRLASRILSTSGSRVERPTWLHYMT